MSAILNPYLHFSGNAREAMKFYESVFGGELSLMTFGEGGSTSDDPEGIMHAQLTTPSGFTLMASDGSPDNRGASGPSISLSGDAEAELTGYWEKLSEGGNVFEPLSKAPWGDSFGMCADKFGVTWLVNISGGQSAA